MDDAMREAISEAEQELLSIREHMDRNITSLALEIANEREQTVYTVYASMCDEANICREVGCWNEITQPGFCEEHDESPIPEKERLRMVLAEAAEALAKLESQDQEGEQDQERRNE